MTRNEAIFELIKYRRRLEENPTTIFGRGSFDADPFDMAVEALECKRGRWIDTGSGQECSICKEIQYGYDSARNFCPNCGADMRGNEDE